MNTNVKLFLKVFLWTIAGPAAIAIGIGTGALVRSLEPPPIQPVEFHFDDNYRSTYDVAYPILKKYGLVGTVYLTTRNLSERRREGYMIMSEIAELKNAGWTIQAHTVSHPDLTTLTPGELDYELRSSKWDLEHMFSVEVTEIASPYGEYNAQVEGAMTEYYDSHRAACWLYGRTIHAFTRGTVCTDWKTTVEELKDWVDMGQIIDTDTFHPVALAFHRIGEEGEFNWTSEQFEKIAAYAAAHSR